jgi:hypothetical protein
MNSVEIAKQKLQESDWSVLPDLQPTLLNQQEFIEYRYRLRNIVIYNTQFGSLPPEPTAVWATPQDPA